MEECSRCLKKTGLCVCDSIQSLDTRIHVLILQHPQEPDKNLGSARLAHLSLPNSTLRIGLSWPNLRKALGREVQPSRWAVLYLGSGIKQGSPVVQESLVLVDKKGSPLPEYKEILKSLEGVVILDGTWSQAKALWWRNAWLLKLRRAILVPQQQSLYRELRREPRRECLSTIESIGCVLSALGEPSTVQGTLCALFERLLNQQRTLLRSKRIEPGDRL